MLRLLALTKRQKTCLDVAVVGAGHAGIEAACAAHRMGLKTKIFTHKKSTIGEMPCNPSFGGIGKGHLLKEVDALDGITCKILDKSSLFFRMLNTSAGPAVWGPRAQISREGYKEQLKFFLENDEVYKNLEIIEGDVVDFEICENSGRISAIVTSSERFEIKALVLCTGTFLNAQTHYGSKIRQEGRRGEPNSTISSKNTSTNIFSSLLTKRAKTGTPPRVKYNSVNWSHKNLTKYSPDINPDPFSYFNEKMENNYGTLNCYTTFGNVEKISKIVYDSKDENEHVKADKADGPTYCPSIESKVFNFGNSGDYSFWLEPEKDPKINPECDVYIQGCSATMPENYQNQLIKAISGLENAEITKYGYGVEYSFVNPSELNKGLMVKKIPGLFLAGQICGTTGYEEAASLGVLAGANAGKFCKFLEIESENNCEASLLSRFQPFTIPRSKAYLGVMVDDLTDKGVDKVYRMFTSRAEYRLFLRQENADFRLTKFADENCPGLITETRLNYVNDLEENFLKIKNFLEKKRFTIKNSGKNRKILEKYKLIEDSFPKKVKNVSIYEFLRICYFEWKRKDKNSSPSSSFKRFEDEFFEKFLSAFEELEFSSKSLDGEVSCKSDFQILKILAETSTPKFYRLRQKLLVDSLYYPVLRHQKSELLELEKLRRQIIPNNLNYKKVNGLKNEERNILEEKRPGNFEELNELRGISVNAALVVYRFLQLEK